MVIIFSVYQNGKYILEVVREVDLERHKTYCMTNRQGMGIFINAECIQRGYLSGWQVKHWKRRIELVINNNIISNIYPNIAYDINGNMETIPNNFKNVLEDNKPKWFI